jgi:hypothetical protein
MNAFSADPGAAGGESPVTEQAKEQVQQVADRAHDVAGDAQVKIREQLDTRATQVGEQVAATALALRSGADELYRQGNDSAGEAAHRAAAQAERLGSYLQGSDANQLLGDAEEFARRNPWAVVVGGVFAGAAAARFLKASSSSRYESSRDGSWPPATANGGGR